ncbi:tetratricopeptide repeat protein [Escherichia coli]
MSGSAFAVTHHAFSSGAGRTSDGNGSHASTLKSPSYTKSVSWQHYHEKGNITDAEIYYKFLCIYAFENHEYLKDFASVCQPKKKYQQAYDLYKLSYNYSPYDDYSVIYRMGQCQIGAKNIDNAMQCFYHIINNCEDDSVKSKAQAYIKLLNDNSEDNG